jgi:signal transduction histidine kinase/ActR/RegA family two-component response regulator
VLSLVARLFVLVVFALLPGLGMQIYNEFEARQARAQEGQFRALQLTKIFAEQQSLVLHDARQLLRTLGTISAQSADKARCDALFADLKQTYQQYTSLISFNLNGVPICASGAAAPVSMRADSYLGEALRTRTFVASTYEAEPTGGLGHIHLAQPFLGADGKIEGVVAAELNLAWVNEELDGRLLPIGASVSLIDRKGTILARHPGTQQFVGKSVPGGSHAYLLSGGEGVQEALGFDGISRIFAYAPLRSGDGLTVSVGLDKREILQTLDAANQRGLLTIPAQAALGLLLAGIGAYLFFERPLTGLLAAADLLRRGDLHTGAKLPENATVFGRLGAAFNTMADAIAAREVELERRVAVRTDELQIAMTARQATEAALHQAQKMEAVGRLTGGIAHDFNNLLAVVVGNLEMARSRLITTHPVAERLEMALASAQRGAKLTQHLLAFGRRQTLHPEVIDVNQHIATTQEMLQRLLPANIAVQTVLAPDAWPVRVDPNQLATALLNLAINARDAMPHGGSLHMKTKNETLVEEPATEGPGGDFVAISVRDTGTGIPPALLDKVFDPFFTTKEVGKGSGLGLSMVHGFTRQSTGTIRVDSVVGEGTCITVYLPRSLALPSVLTGRANDHPRTLARGDGTVLVVDDDDDVRSVLRDMLQQLGYTVLAAQDVTEAMTLFERDNSEIDLIIIDVVLSGRMNGYEFARELRDENPDLPLIFVSGDGDDSGAVPARLGHLLAKPFEFAELADTVYTAMSKRRRWRTAAVVVEAVP